MPQLRFPPRWYPNRPLLLLILLSVLALWLLFLAPSDSRRPQVAAAKGTLINVNTVTLSPFESAARAATLGDSGVMALLGSKNVEFLGADPLGVGEAGARGLERCESAACSHLTFYNYTDGGTIEAITDVERGVVLEVWQDPLARPRATRLIVDKVLSIANRDSRVRETVGDLSGVELAMIPMSIWLIDDDCRTDWCVDLTFPSPEGDGRVLHVTVNMQDQRVARLFYTRGRPAASLQTETPPDYFAQLDENAPLFTDGCHEAAMWSVCWETTAHDGLNFFDARYDDQLIFSSAKISQVEVYYPAWPGGYRDEIGFNASVPPKFDTRVVEIEDGFEVRQIFTEPFDWPSCVCCYRYEQVAQFNADGSFDLRFISYGPGCDDLSVYRPFWRVDVELGQPAENQVFQWAGDAWREVENELDRPLFQELSPTGQVLTIAAGETYYRWKPVTDDPLGLDEGRLFVLQYDENEGAGPIEAGPADTLEPPRQWLDDDDAVSGENVVVWFIPFLKTKKQNPWYCMPEPAPDLSPCEALMQVVPASGLEEEPAATPTATSPGPTGTATITPTATVAVTPPASPTPPPIPGETAEEIISNAGCGACHVIGQLGEEGKVGPDLTNIADMAGERVEGLDAEAYLRQSILMPNVHIAPECPNSDCLPNIMPNFSNRLSDEQIDTLVTYLLTLTDAEAMATAEPVVGEDAVPAPTADPADGAQASGDDGDQAALLLMVGALFVALIGAAVYVYLRNRRDAPAPTEDA